MNTSGITSVLGGPQSAGTQPGLALVASTAITKSLPPNQQVAFTGGTTNASATAVILDPNNQPMITLQAKSPGVDGNLTTAVVASSGVRNPGTFDLDLTWVETLTGVTAADFLQRVQSGSCRTEVTAAAAASGGKPYLPAEGVTTLFGGVDSNATTGVTAVQASAYIFGASVTICLQPGSYRLPVPLVIGPEHGRLTIEACGKGATLSGATLRVRSDFPEGMIQLLGPRDLTLRGVSIAIPPASSPAQPAAQLSLKQPAVAQTSVITLAIVVQSAIGVRVVGCRGFTLESCTFNYPVLASTNGAIQFWFGIDANGDCSDLRLLNNRFAGPSNAVAPPPSALVLTGGYIQNGNSCVDATDGTANTVVPSTSDRITFHGNDFTNVDYGVIISASTGFVKFDSNRVSNALLALSIELPGSAAPPASLVSLLVPTVVALVSAIPLPAAYTPTRKLTIGKPAAGSAARAAAAPAAPAGTAPPATSAKTAVTSAALNSPAVSAFVRNISQMLAQAITSSSVLLLPAILPGSRIHISGNDIDVTSFASGTALSLSGSVDANGDETDLGFVTITGNILRSQSSSPTVDLQYIAGVAIAGNVVSNVAVVVISCRWARTHRNQHPDLFPADTESAITGNVLNGAPPILPNRRGGVSSPEDSWIVFNETVL